MAHGVLHRVQQQVRACPQTGPLPCSCASSVLRDSTAQGCQGIAWAALPGCCSSFSQGHSVLPGQRFEDPRCVLLRCHRFSGCRLLLNRSLARSVPLCCTAPIRAVKPFVSRWPASFSQAAKTRAVSCVSHGSKNKGRLSVLPRRPATRTLHALLQACRTHSAACPSLPGTQGGQYTALCSGAASTQPSAQHRLL